MVRTTERDKRQRAAPDLVKREFVAKDINQLWVADMTYVPTWEGFLYLAVVTDVFSRKVVGWAFGVQMTADLVIMARRHRNRDQQPVRQAHRQREPPLQLGHPVASGDEVRGQRQHQGRGADHPDVAGGLAIHPADRAVERALHVPERRQDDRPGRASGRVGFRVTEFAGVPA
jgi:transposase InsO family protein